ncbi:unnamed protein product [Gongylonema pulchrum]|uniref:Uncharacterized protein n=1 Tax=Gongylonema pulchrum TaxID=637853 RepID=A0A183E645_9BILA|nr:unnamed protein product [Gongylonema pulchrum]
MELIVTAKRPISALAQTMVATVGATASRSDEEALCKNHQDVCWFEVIDHCHHHHHRHHLQFAYLIIAAGEVEHLDS